MKGDLLNKLPKLHRKHGATDIDQSACEWQNLRLLVKNPNQPTNK